MAVVRALVESPYLAHPGQYHEGDWVFFDVLGMFVVFYSMRIGTCLNYAAVLAVLCKIAYNFYCTAYNNQKSKRLRRPGLVEGIFCSVYCL